MLMLLLAAGAMAATPHYSYDVNLGFLSPLIQYSSRPFFLDPVNATYPSLASNASDVPPGWRDPPKIQPLNDSQLQPYLEMGWTAVMYDPGTLYSRRQAKDAVVTECASRARRGTPRSKLRWMGSASEGPTSKRTATEQVLGCG
jgi:hypothetical protein